MNAAAESPTEAALSRALAAGLAGDWGLFAECLDLACAEANEADRVRNMSPRQPGNAPK